MLDFLTWRRRVKIMKRPGSKPAPWSDIGGRLKEAVGLYSFLDQFAGLTPALMELR